MEHYQGHMKYPQQIKHDHSEVVWCSWSREHGKQRWPDFMSKNNVMGLTCPGISPGSGEGTHVLSGCDLVCSSARTCPGQLISSLKSVWGVPNGPSSLYPSYTDGTRVSCPWSRGGENWSCSAQKALAAAAGLLKPYQLWGTGEVGCLTWEWHTWCVVSFPINSRKAKTETWQWFCLQRCCCRVLCPTPAAHGAHRTAPEDARDSQNYPSVCCSLPVGLCHLSNLQETALPSL